MQLLSRVALNTGGNLLLLLATAMLGSGITLYVASKTRAFGEHYIHQIVVYADADEVKEQTLRSALEIKDLAAEVDAHRRSLVNIEKHVDAVGGMADAVYFSPGMPGYETAQADFCQQLLGTAKSADNV